MRRSRTLGVTLLGVVLVAAMAFGAGTAQASCDTLVHCLQDQVNTLPSTVENQLDQAIQTVQNRAGSLPDPTQAGDSQEVCLLEGQTRYGFFGTWPAGDITCARPSG